MVNDHSKQKVSVDQLPSFLSHLTFEVILLGLTYSQRTPGSYTRVRSGTKGVAFPESETQNTQSPKSIYFVRIEHLPESSAQTS